MRDYDHIYYQFVIIIIIMRRVTRIFYPPLYIIWSIVYEYDANFSTKIFSCFPNREANNSPIRLKIRLYFFPYYQDLFFILGKRRKSYFIKSRFRFFYPRQHCVSETISFLYFTQNEKKNFFKNYFSIECISQRFILDAAVETNCD